MNKKITGSEALCTIRSHGTELITQVTQWDFQNKGTRTSLGRLSFVLKIPLCNLRPSGINSVPCDRIVQRAYFIPVKILVVRKASFLHHSIIFSTSSLSTPTDHTLGYFLRRNHLFRNGRTNALLL